MQINMNLKVCDAEGTEMQFSQKEKHGTEMVTSIMSFGASADFKLVFSYSVICNNSKKFVWFCSILLHCEILAPNRNAQVMFKLFSNMQ